MTHSTTTRPKVVIIGAGFGGISAAKTLAREPVDIKIIDRRNYHLFQPLLYQVATADLSPADVAWPIRGIFSRQNNVSVALTEVVDVDLAARQVVGETDRYEYDYLIVASGAHHSYFGRDDWEKHAPGLKRIIDATEIRKQVLVAFERAEISNSDAEQRRQLTFVVVGGGPTGVEMAGAIAELANHALARDFHRINSRDARIVLIEAGDRLLNAFPEKLSNKAQKSLEKLGVEVMVDTRVEDITEEGVHLQGSFIPAACKIWGAGVVVKNVGQWLDVETDRSGRIPVTKDLSLQGHPEVFVIGDAARVPWKDGLDVPGIAPAAKQGGAYVGKRISQMLKGRAATAPFAYKHAGTLATIGRHSAVIDFGKFQMSGFLAWWLWGIAHIYFLIGVRKPLMVAFNWFWSYLTFSKGARLITGLRPLYEDRDTDPKPTASKAG
ncbi:NAD(P)/FAD-dependent oxidoreductase [Rhodophyticola sp. CCM32]|uniref:NAD(P)/FAD-dependent oxidoreductase n=1 Tax=Rhodophyticola sp. CCM32 TaxID=2916397 RepID=UPI00107FC685|nr:NAD(P)/FAD-dependent oxidoreductase [Rhodophyticola sp. CCM32]QBY00797.1 NAD(P)/FAD-dependent oxidoreductase [Rhodophyticola sp. CCM32]